MINRSMSENKKVREVFEFLSKANRRAYNDIYLISNPVLSKDTHTTRFFDYYLSGKPVGSQPFGILLVNLAFYYAKSLFYYFRYLINHLVHFLSGQKFQLEDVKGELILIDTFFLSEKIEKEMTFNDPYFSGLEKVLHKLGKSFAYVPIFFPAVNLLRFSKMLRLLKRERVPVLTEYQLLSTRDLLLIFGFLITYPFHVLRFANSIKDDSYENRLLKYELLDNISQVTFFAFSRYLQGKRISSIGCSKIKVISWFENQIFHKNFYKGLHTGNGNVFIYGCQLFLYATSLLSILVDPYEVPFGVVPDKILVNGPFYLYKDKRLNCAVCPSFRYRQLFETEMDFGSRNNLMVLLPMQDKEIINILKILKSVDWPAEEMLIRFHPATNRDKYEEMLPKKAKISEGNIYESFKTTKVVLGGSSGSLVEAVSLGIPAIVVRDTGYITHNYLSEYGKGVIWDWGQNVAELNEMIIKFDLLLNRDRNTINRFAGDYRSMFFCEVTEQSIIHAFDLGAKSAA